MATKSRSQRYVPDPVDMDDPLSKALRPPKDESPEDRAQRLQKQEAAARVSQEIDESLQESRRAYEKRKKAIKILLLGKVSRTWGERSLGTVLIASYPMQARLNLGKALR